MEITVPLMQATWFIIGVTFGRGFGKKLDQGIVASKWFKKRNPIVQGLLKRILDVTHHFWVGLLLMLYIPMPEIYWFGAGLFVDDLPDVPRRYRKMFGFLEGLQ